MRYHTGEMMDGQTLTLILEAARAGDEDAFAALVGRFAPGLYQYFVVTGIQPHDAEDLVQETFLRVHQAFARYDERYAFSTWLYTIGRRLAINLHRRRRPVLALQEEWHPATPEPHPEPETGIDTVWQTARERLSAKLFETLWLFYGEDKSIAEIGAIMGCTRVNAKVRLHRARNRLAAILREPASRSLAHPVMEAET